MNWKRLLACAVGAICSLVAPASGMVIDDFEAAPFSVSYSPPFTNVYVNQDGLPPANVLLGRRSVAMDAGSTSGTFASLLTNSAADDAAVVSVPAGQTASFVVGYLTWFSSGGTPLGNVNLTAGGHNGIAITVTQAPASFQLDVFLATDPIPGHRAGLVKPASGPGQYLFPFADFVPFSGESMPSLNDIDVLTMHAVATAGATPVTIAISDIRTVVVPEPSGMAATFIATLVLRRRRME